ncbi:LVIVD repeat-containing protein [Pontibacter sp. SGAir0037]|uniref:LVIVD repeat-containing protein n=1 Tax=Pontibacter sp. SGAir0037 TaxID=2571030 RepID=UPI0010CCD3FD|nr:hypothetical protein [Pontibacter sp. SGAir0037]QCR21750.1 hypothetical protein C1N53_04930 [Pontibacter sp. SGAir0037]
MKKLNLCISAVCIVLATLQSCETDSSSIAREAVSPTGKGGSMARFAVSGDYLYTVDNNNLNLFNITSPTDPVKEKTVPLSFGVETIFPFEDKLFVGTQTGMHILSVENPASPQELSHYSHTFSCDPVVTDGRYAYVTLRTGTNCGRAINELQIIDIQNITNPVLKSQYQMVNPMGLGIDGNNLFVCDDGLKMYDASNVNAITLKKHFNINAFDVIPDKGNLLVVGSDGFYQYQYLGESLELLSKITIQPSS